MVTVSIIGVGRVGGALALALPKDKYTVDNLIGREETAGEISSEVVFITTQDSEITTVAESLVGKLKPGTIVFHTSGSNPSSILDALKDAGCKTGSIHPLVSVSSPELGPERFRGAYFCVEGDEEAVTIGKQIVGDLGGKPFAIDTKFKTLYHASAVTACGHLVALFDAAVEMMTKVGLSDADAKEILLPLVTSTVQNLGEQTTAAALTGTFARADIETFTRHLGALNQYVSDDLLEIYLLLGERSLELAAKQGVSPERIDTLRTKVSIAKSKLKW
ncbi:MAG TPA: DUF2520 domain-containing protein [Pyrinomonadaceae bacterium]|nr:DUF2520 domain-containing protein [Pyrinomonadaceae bacterium]